MTLLTLWYVYFAICIYVNFYLNSRIQFIVLFHFHFDCKCFGWCRWWLMSVFWFECALFVSLFYLVMSSSFSGVSSSCIARFSTHKNKQKMWLLELLLFVFVSFVSITSTVILYFFVFGCRFVSSCYLLIWSFLYWSFRNCYVLGSLFTYLGCDYVVFIECLACIAIAVYNFLLNFCFVISLSLSLSR